MKRVSEAGLRELNELALAGNLTPAAVLERATDASNALHELFTWDDERAAHLRRLDEARGIIMSVKVRIETQPDRPAISVRAFVSLAEDRLNRTGYRPITVVMGDPVQRAQLLQTAMGEMDALRRRYAQLSELALVFAAMDEVAQQRTG